MLYGCTFGTIVVLEVILVTQATLEITELNWTELATADSIVWTSEHPFKFVQ